uniref:Uncharacterized protein LOC105125639 n=1 Tax=Rhizophora mucronata TaxID=61149 RepID=A0A2P2MHQ0_RHIMU
MLLRSSSTPVLGSLLSSFSDSPSNSNNYHQHDTTNHILKNHQSLSKLPYYQSMCRNLVTISCNSSPISPSFAEFSNHSQTGFHRTQSEGYLEGLPYASCNSNEENHNSSQPKKLSGRPNFAMLDTIPSLSFCNSRGRYEDDYYEEEDDDEEWSGVEDGKDEKDQWKEKAAMHAGHFGLSKETKNIVLSEKVREMDRTWNADFEEKRSLDSEELHLAKELGIDGGINNGNGGGCGNRGGGSGGEFNSAGGDDEYIHGTEEYYKRMVQENPGNALFLRNYAQFLYRVSNVLFLRLLPFLCHKM